MEQVEGRITVGADTFVVLVADEQRASHHLGNFVGGDAEEVLAQFAKAGVDVEALAAQLQDEGAKSFVKSWDELMTVIATKSATLKKAS